MKNCRFCKALIINHQIHEFSKQQTPAEVLEHNGECMVDYSVAIVKRKWYQKRGKKSASRTVEFKYRGYGFDLNYCPECGRKVKPYFAYKRYQGAP